MPDATFATPDVTTFCRLDELGLVVVNQNLEPDRAVLACRVADDPDGLDRWCRQCGCEGRARDTVTRRLAHEPLGWRPTTLRLTIRRYKCTGCGHVWGQDTSRAAEPRAKLSRSALRWALVGLVCQHLTVARLAEALAVSWGGEGDWTAVHHAFTSPKPEFADTFDTDPGAALAYAYDIVCNGNEIGGGSIRIHRRDVQQRVFALMGISPEQAAEKFGFLLEAFRFGAPPHGGIAFGWDRIVMLLAGAASLREVIAFPKSGGGYDPLTGAPAPITAQQRKEAGVDAKRPDKVTAAS